MQHQAHNPGARPDTITLHTGKPNRAGSHPLDEENIGTLQFEVWRFDGKTWAAP